MATDNIDVNLVATDTFQFGDEGVGANHIERRHTKQLTLVVNSG